MLDEEMRYFLEYCRISDFSKKSIESLSIRLNEFNEFLKTNTVISLIQISYQHLRRFIVLGDVLWFCSLLIYHFIAVILRYFLTALY